MLCKDIMKKDVQCASAEASIQSVALAMRESNIGFIPVCDENLRVVGTITDRDLAIRAVAQGLPAKTTLESLMTRQVVACKPEDELDQARELMAQHHKSRIVCVNHNGQLLGVISLSDIAQVDEKSGLDTLRKISGREARGNSVSAR